jgi:hypothetical protein
MRIVAPAFLALGLLSANASASAILLVEDTAVTPSILDLQARADTATPSIVAAGEIVPAVSGEKVAAVPSTSSTPPDFDLMVIRAGIVEHAGMARGQPATR